ncbi:PEP-CTERM sorting domain-containing protein [Coraliomargarita parva]|uniref:PEP-CTERM sorting domain-containing protein n=1 Tax=Coraliomargarita parva TaxID=3014050 RepID=UPI0022B4DDE5|nr:PEP-CTERM sorting domain-containing protein [Coraliomargarita parva]
MKSPIITILALSGAAFSLAQAETVLFSDNFDTSANSWDVNFEYDSGTRQSGTLGNSQYYVADEPGYWAQVDHDSYLDALSIHGNGPTYDTSVTPYTTFDYDLAAGESLSMSIDLNPYDDASSWAAMSIGNTGGAEAISTGFGVLVRSDATYEIWSSGSSVASGTATSFTDYGTLEILVSGVSGAAYTWDGSDADVEVIFEGSSIYAATITGGYTQNFLTLLSYNAGGANGFDNLTVSVVPEPSTYAMLAGCFGLAFVILKRRRQA